MFNTHGVDYAMHHIILRAVMLAFAATLIASVEIRHKCDRDSDCVISSSSTSHYCKLSFCERCFPCEMAKRFPSPSSPGCARGEEDCGSCLPGYQAEDLTTQRRTFKCFATPDDQSELTFPWANILSLTVTVLVVVAALIAAFATFYVKYLQKEEKESGAIEENIELMPCAPPPYYDETDNSGLSTVRVSEIRTVAQLEVDHVSRAAPMGRFHHFEEVMSEDEEGPMELPLEEPLMDESGSTETIPSTWEHNSFYNLPVESRISLPEVTVTDQSRRGSSRISLVRSQSMELPVLHRLCPVLHWGSSSQSDPALPTVGNRRSSLGGESYRHRHVRLSTHRISSQQTINNASVETVSYDEEEPNAPQSFIFPDVAIQASISITRTALPQYLSPTPSAQGSQDSGFHDQNRRRPRQPQQEESSQEMTAAEFGIVFSVAKKPRNDYS